MAIRDMLPQRILAARHMRTDVASITYILMGFQVHTQIILIAELFVAYKAGRIQFRVGRWLLLCVCIRRIRRVRRMY